MIRGGAERPRTRARLLRPVGRLRATGPASRASLALLLSSLLTGGCFSASRELSKEQARQQTAWLMAVSEAPGPIRRFDWDQALAQVKAHNPKVREADLAVARAAEAVGQVKRSLIPTANLEAGYDRLFVNGQNSPIEPFTFAASLFFDVPGVISFRTRYEAAILALAKARFDRETTWREQVITLYRIQAEGREMEAHGDTLDRGWAEAESLDAGAPEAAAAERSRIIRDRTEVEARRQDWQKEAGELLGLPGARIAFSAQGVPPLPYEAPASRPSPGDLARLPLRLAALELVALRAQQLGLRMQSLPEFNATVSSPAFYQSGTGSGGAWSPAEIVSGVNAYWTLDTQGNQASQQRLIGLEIAFRREVLDQERAAAAARLRSALDGLAGTDSRLAAIDRAIASAPPAVRPALVRARESVATDRRNWQLTIWLFDDARWSPLSA